MPRTKKKYHYLYKTTNMINNKFYVGMHSTSNLEDEYLGSGLRLRRSIRKYGKENFVKEILMFFKDREELVAAEIEIVNSDLIKEELCMNLRIGGTGGLNGVCSESILRIRKGASDFAKAQWQDPNFVIINGLARSSELKRRHENGLVNYNTFEGKNHTEETKQKISAANSIKLKGVNNSQYGTCWITKQEENKKIKKEELELYISLGWSKGRITKTQNKNE